MSSIKIHNDILSTVGNTPLVRLNHVARRVKPTLCAKLEHYNPGGSMKDRIALNMIDAAEKDGSLKPGGTIVECTSGNTGAGLAQVAAVKGYKTVFTVPDKMSREKVNHMKALGSEVVVTPTVPHSSPDSYQAVAERIVQSTPGAILMNQYFNPANIEAHYLTTGKEIWEQTEGRITHLVASTGTGGTLSGVGKYMKEQNPNVKIIGVDPVGSAFNHIFRTGEVGDVKPYKIEGAGMDEMTGTMLLEYVDQMLSVGDKESFLMTRELARREGIFAGGSSGMVTCGALRIARDLGEEALIVLVFPDIGYKYLSKIYDDSWMLDNGYADDNLVSVESLLSYKVGEISQLLYASPEDTVRSALDKMLEFNISQMPVISRQGQLGSLEEHHLMATVLDDRDSMKKPVKEVMKEGFPIVEHDSTVRAVREYVVDQRRHAVLVSKNADLVGIITKSDLLGLLN